MVSSRLRRPVGETISRRLAGVGSGGHSSYKARNADVDHLIERHEDRNVASRRHGE
jgi:hypothetical protein